MKRLFIIAACAALALTACQKVTKMEEGLQGDFQEGFTGTEIRVPVSMDGEVLTKSFDYLDYDHRNDTQGYDWSPVFFNNDGTSKLLGMYSLNGRWYGYDYYLNNTVSAPSYLSREGGKCELVMNLSQPIDGGEGYSHFIVGFNAKMINPGYYTSFASGSTGNMRFVIDDTVYQKDASASHLDGIEPIYAVGSVKCSDGTPGQDFKFHHVASLFRFYVKNTGTIPITVNRVVLNNYDGTPFDKYTTVSFDDNTTTEEVPEPALSVTYQTPVVYNSVYCSDPGNTGWNTIAPGEIATFYTLASGRTDVNISSKSFAVEVYDHTNTKIVDKRISGADIVETTGVTHFQAGYAYNFSVKAVGKSFEVDGINYTIYSGTTVNVAPKVGYYQQETISIPSAVTLNGVTYQVVGIGSSAFNYAPNLKSVTIAEGVKTIGANAFVYCPQLEEVVLPSTVNYINNANAVFSHSPKLSVRFSADNPRYHVDASGVLYDGSEKRLVFLPPKLTGDYTVEEGTEGLGVHSIENPHFSSLTLPVSIRYWDGYTFCFSEVPESTFRLILNWNAEQLSAFSHSSSPAIVYFRQYVYGTGTFFDKFILDVPEGMVDAYKAKSIFTDTTYDSTGERHFTWATH